MILKKNILLKRQISLLLMFAFICSNILLNNLFVSFWSRYNDLRMSKLEKPIYPVGVLMNSEVMHSDEPLRIAEENAIPEFKKYNIIESEVRNVV